MISRSALAAALLLVPAVAAAQDMPGMDHSQMDHGTMDHSQMGHAAPEAKPAQTAPMDHAQMDHSAMGHDDMAGMDMSDHSMAGHGMTGALGAYGMTRDASGTAWQPDSAPMMAIMGEAGGWSTMLHGFATLAYDKQGGPRGDEKTFVASMIGGMAQRPLGGGTLTLKAMGSLDPFMGKRGYPLLLATGETADGKTELVDRQHPHDAFMELAAVYSHPIREGVSGFVYLGLPGEPALGPATYMHRFSGLANPEAPIGHHWLDSTHVTFGVATAGLVVRNVKLEASSFTGREPDKDRWDIERPRMDSWSTRVSWNPTPDLSLQISRARINSPEALHPEEDIRRTTASATWGRSFEGGLWQGTFAWGRNDPTGGHDAPHVTDAFLVDGAVQFGRHTLFARAERVDKDELFGEDHANPLVGRVFTVSKLSVGGYHSLPFGPAALDLGGLVSVYDLPGPVKTVYGDPTSGMLFARFRITG